MNKLVGGFACIVAFGTLPAQTWRVPVAVFTNRTPGKVDAALRRAISNADGTLLVNTTDSAYYRLRVTSFPICGTQECVNPSKYFVGITLSESLTGVGALGKLDWLKDSSLVRQVDTIATRFRDYEILVNAWTFEWSDWELNARAGEFIDRLDVRCFEQLRLLIRQNQMHSAEAKREVLREVASRKWEC